MRNKRKLMAATPQSVRWSSSRLVVTSSEVSRVAGSIQMSRDSSTTRRYGRNEIEARNLQCAHSRHRTARIGAPSPPAILSGNAAKIERFNDSDAGACQGMMVLQRFGIGLIHGR